MRNVDLKTNNKRLKICDWKFAVEIWVEYKTNLSVSLSFTLVKMDEDEDFIKIVTHNEMS